jgi:hypothetical protein
MYKTSPTTDTSSFIFNWLLNPGETLSVSQTKFSICFFKALAKFGLLKSRSAGRAAVLPGLVAGHMLLGEISTSWY